jgi:hypothetical protein
MDGQHLWQRRGVGTSIKKAAMGDGTRVIFWVDIAILIIVCALVLAGQWDYVIALFVALIALNFFDQWRSRHRSRN